MKVTYIHHSSFLVETEHVILLFDYFEGKLPAFSRDKPLFVFASHFHGDHYSPSIFKLAEKQSNISFILSKDIKKKDVPEHLKDRVRFVKAGEKFEVCSDPRVFDPQADSNGMKQAQILTVETFKSTDEGVAFWILCEGKQIYHAGDLNNWWWEGEDKAWNHNMEAGYKREIDRMAGREADAAFVPVDPRLGGQFYYGLDGFMKKVSARAIFPMHFWNDYSIIDKMKQHPCSEGYREKIMSIHEEGEEFIL